MNEPVCLAMRRCMVKTKGKSRQSSILDTALPLFRKPADKIGETFKLPGSAWGSACPAADANKMFVVAITDFFLAHRERANSLPIQAFQLQEQGEDGCAGNSVPFMMAYPDPFLRHWYDTYPQELQALKNPQSIANQVEGTIPEDDVGEGWKVRSEAWQHVKIVGSEKVVGGKQNGCLKHHGVCMIEEAGRVCGSKMTIYGNSTTVIFKHIRRFARKDGCTGHRSALDLLNASSSRKVQLPSGEWVTVHSFEEAFPHHCDFAWLVAGGLSMRLNRRPIFLEYIRGFQPRAVMPHN
jgi:hypothetical protein